MNQVNKAVRYWIDSAEYDLGVADSLFEKEKYHYSLFFGHLALEKILKAIYVKYKQDHAPITHALPYLAERSGLEIEKRRLEKLAEFMEFYIEGIYPKNMQEVYDKYDWSFTSAKLKEVRGMFAWLKKKLNK